MTDRFDPRPEHKFTFGLWTVGNPGRDAFGLPTRAPIAPPEIVALLADCGAYGVNLHDEDLIPFGSSAAERDRIVADFKQALADHGLRVPMATTNLFTQPVFKDGAFTSNDPAVRAYALQKTAAAIELGVELGAETYVFWGGREGTESNASKDHCESIKRFREAINWLTHYCVDRGYDLKFALEAKPNEPRCDIYLPTTGAMLGFIATLDHPDRVGVNPEVAHEVMAGLDFSHALAQAWEAGKLFHVDLNDQLGPRYDQDLRFGSANPKAAFWTVRFLESCGYQGMRHFDAHAYRSEDLDGVRDFAKGCMRTYVILKERAAAFDADPEVRDLLGEIRADDGSQADVLGVYSKEKADLLARRSFDVDRLGSKGLQLERLDQLAIEHLLGAR